MKQSKWLGLAMIILLAGCDENDGPGDHAGEATITSEVILEGATYTFNGFSFDLGKVVYFNPASGGEPPDLVVSPDNSGPAIIAFLQLYNNVQQKLLFALAGEFDTTQEADGFFTGYKQVADTLTYSVWARPIIQNQIWVIRTVSNHYAKIQIREVVTDIVDTKPYAETTFRWVYQPDGTTTF